MIGTLLLRDFTASNFTKKEKNIYFLLFLFFLAVYAPGITWLYNVCMWLLFVYSFFFNSLQEKWALLKIRPTVLLMILFFLVNCMSAVLSANTKEGISWVGIRLSILIFPITLGTIFIPAQLKERIILAFITASFLAAAGCLGYGIMRVITSQDLSLLYNDNLSQLVNLQSIYFAMLINIAFIGIGYLLVTGSELIKKKFFVDFSTGIIAGSFFTGQQDSYFISVQCNFPFWNLQYSDP